MKKVLLLFFPIALMLWFSCEEAEDCAGVLGGEAEIDECGVCDEDPANDCIEDCAGLWGGTAVEDNCGVCDENPANDCTEDCAGIWGGENICGCTDESANNYSSEATYDDGSCEYFADVNSTITGVSWAWYETYATMQFRLTNQGGGTAYNVEYRLRYSYKCSGQFTNAPSIELTDLISCCDLQPGEYIDLEVQVTNLCTTNGGLNYFTFDYVDYLTWD